MQKEAELLPRLWRIVYINGSCMHTQKGFTLIELLVALGVFAVIGVSVSGIFLFTSRSQRKSALQERALGDARYIMESIAGDIRVGIPDYTAYGGPVGAAGVDLLRLRYEDGAAIIYRRSSDAAECPASSAPCVMRDVGGIGASLTSQGVVVDTLLFYIAPATNPFSPGASTLAQPRVTIVLRVRAQEPGVDPVDIHVQTTASSRVYGL